MYDYTTVAYPGGAEGAAAPSEMLRKFKNYINGL